MKKYVWLLVCLMDSVFCHAQSKDFEQVYEACLLVQSSMSDGMGSNQEVAHAAELLNGAKWSYLRLNVVDAAGQTEFGEKSIVFTPEYLKQFSQDKTLVYNKAKEYAAEKASKKRGEGQPVRLCTQCIVGNGKVVYGIRQMGNSLNVAAVAEVDGLINLSVTLVDMKGTKYGPHKITSNEFEGMPSRKLTDIPMKKGYVDVYITIENKYSDPKSVAVIVESCK